MQLEFDDNPKINDYFHFEYGKKLFQHQNIYESEERNTINIFGTRFPIIETECNQQKYLSIPTKETRKDFNFIHPIRNVQTIEQLLKSPALRILEVFRYIITFPIDPCEKEFLYPTQQEVLHYYPKFHSPQITEYLNEKRILCIRDDSGEIADMSIATRRKSAFSELSIHIKPKFQKRGLGYKLLNMMVNQELNLDRIIILVTERNNHSANSVIQRLDPERTFTERIVIV
jgi:GNAT superfamily N-acetyltransferase